MTKSNSVNASQIITDLLPLVHSMGNMNGESTEMAAQRMILSDISSGHIGIQEMLSYLDSNSSPILDFKEVARLLRLAHAI